MQGITGKPALMKRMNLSLICRTLSEMGTATRAEIAARTAISTTTVRSLLEDLLQNGDLLELELDASSGGRRARRYALNPERNQTLCLYTEGGRIIYRVVSPSGEPLASGCESFSSGDPLPSLLYFLENARKTRDIRAVGLGVPGIVEKGRYYVSCDEDGQWVVSDVGERLEQHLGVPVILENDLNCIAIGFSRRYASALPTDSAKCVNLAYIHLNQGCSGAGIIADGKVVHGAKRFAGELGFLPIASEKTLDDILRDGNPFEAADATARAIACLNCVTNPSLIILGGERLDNGSIDVAAVRDRVRAYVPDIQIPEIIECTDYQEDYLSGLSFLTAHMALPSATEDMP